MFIRGLMQSRVKGRHAGLPLHRGSWLPFLLICRGQVRILPLRYSPKNPALHSNFPVLQSKLLPKVCSVRALFILIFPPAFFFTIIPICPKFMLSGLKFNVIEVSRLCGYFARLILWRHFMPKYITRRKKEK